MKPIPVPVGMGLTGIGVAPCHPVTTARLLVQQHNATTKMRGTRRRTTRAVPPRNGITNRRQQTQRRQYNSRRQGIPLPCHVNPLFRNPLNPLHGHGFAS